MLREQLAKMNTNKQNDNFKPPLSHRAQQQRRAQHAADEQLLPSLMLLNPPIALFEEEDRQRFGSDHKVQER